MGKKQKDTLTGEMQKRSLTDMICCVFYLVFVAACVGIGIYGWSKGDSRNILAP